MLHQIVRLQVQTEPLKQGEKPHRWYDPSFIQRVDRLHVDADGATGEFDERDVLDVHSVTHPRSRNHGRASGLSIGFTSHYQVMRQQFGAHVTDGIAGENVLVAVDGRITFERLAGAALRTAHGDVAFAEVEVAEPCVEFSRLVLGVKPDDRSVSMREPLQQLRGGVRGFYVALAQPVDLTEDDRLILP